MRAAIRRKAPAAVLVLVLATTSACGTTAIKSGDGGSGGDIGVGIDCLHETTDCVTDATAMQDGDTLTVDWDPQQGTYSGGNECSVAAYQAQGDTKVSLRPSGRSDAANSRYGPPPQTFQVSVPIGRIDIICTS
jgi:hypothetical protein